MLDREESSKLLFIRTHETGHKFGLVRRRYVIADVFCFEIGVQLGKPASIRDELHGGNT